MTNKSEHIDLVIIHLHKDDERTHDFWGRFSFIYSVYILGTFLIKLIQLTLVRYISRGGERGLAYERGGDGLRKF